MKHIEGNFKGVRDVDIYYQAWLPEGDVKAVLFVVHGLHEHCGRYMNVVNHFVPLGYAVYTLDHIGHGKSEGQRAFVRRFEDYTDTLAIYYMMVKDWQPDKPIFLLGHILGWGGFQLIGGGAHGRVLLIISSTGRRGQRHCQ